MTAPEGERNMEGSNWRFLATLREKGIKELRNGPGTGEGNSNLQDLPIGDNVDTKKKMAI